MSFVELDRDFHALEADKVYGVESIEAYSLFRSNVLKWPDLLKHERVVVLASAASGKSEEFRESKKALVREKKFAFYVTIERLANGGLIKALNIAERKVFTDWLRSNEPCWFFLDSIDEARINHKDVKGALDAFSSDLGEAYDRARVIISCRGSVWSGRADVELIESSLPILTDNRQSPVEDVSPDQALFNKPERKIDSHPRKRDIPAGVQLVALLKLNKVQRATFLAAQKMGNIEAFEKASFNSGLDALTERPGDLRTLAQYWQENQRFGSLSEMTEFGIAKRVVEASDEDRRAKRTPLAG